MVWDWDSDKEKYSSNVQNNSPIDKESSKMTLRDDSFVDTTGVFDHPYERIQHYVDKILEYRSIISI